MTNLINVLKTMEQETDGVKNDVVNFLIDSSDNSDNVQSLLDDVVHHGCQSGIVNHLIYYKDTVRYYEAHAREIDDFLEGCGIEAYGGSDLIDELSNILPVDDFETRMNDIAILERAYEIVEDENDITSEESESEEYEEEVFNLRYELATEFDDQDKNYLAWAIFENSAMDLQDELSEMGAL